MVLSAVTIKLSKLLFSVIGVHMMIIHLNEAICDLYAYTALTVTLESNISGCSGACQLGAGGATLLQAGHVKQHIIVQLQQK